ncbi:MAG: hypothetical protein A2632_03280 [Candidatus Pacebacteria bacterium RIFCSPHIGHO2_01_FULL_46_16]|nr:MAG: hypothetical protein A2632_03280 [Candidatus Pacebacteria bacterium RIFCSPHIGHO2_01_FULL_46_16]OGJ39441.1 MAG: hypothetical protein A3A82_00060 [Candidatus Pacebacteria bacterium RIFCSPLOWO2_01_FULL_47_12]
MLKLFSRNTQVTLAPTNVLQVVAILLGFYFLFQIRSILMLVFLAFILMVALNPVAKRLQRLLRLTRTLSIVGAYVLLITVLLLLIGLLLPPLIGQLYALLRTINIPLLQEYLVKANFSWTAADLSNLANQIGTSVTSVLSVVLSTFAGIFTVFTLFVLSFFMLVERSVLHRKIAWFTKDAKDFALAEQFLDLLESQLGGWVRGEALLMLSIAVLTYIGLTIIGVPYALPLAILAGLLEILPNIGPTIAAIPAIAIGYITGGPVIAGVVLLLSIVVQQLENSVLVPKIMRENANVNPLISIVAILTGFQLAGVMGALLAIPSYITIRAVYSVFFRP